MESKYYCFINVDINNRISGFRLFDLIQKKCFYGFKKIKTLSFEINENNFIENYNPDYIIPLKKEIFDVFLELNYEKKISNYLLRSVLIKYGLEEHAI
jgi:hypothetical protein